LKKAICVFTGSRSEYGILRPLLVRLRGQNDIRLQLLVGGNHFSGKWGFTFAEIRRDRIPVAGRISSPPSWDSSLSVAEAAGRGLLEISRHLQRLRPHLLVLLGDRYEVLAAATAATLMRIPIAHLHGGETTLGAFDDRIRNAVSQLADLHFVSHPIYRRNLIRMGIPSRSITVSGALFLENQSLNKSVSDTMLNKRLGFSVDSRSFLVAWHPETMMPRTTVRNFRELVAAMEASPENRFLLTFPNADPGHELIQKEFLRLHRRNPHQFKLVPSLGTELFHACLARARAIIGNSSSGILEAPSFGARTINIGNRQKGRLMAPSVISCAPDRRKIRAAIQKALRSRRPRSFFNPLNRKDTTKTIISMLRKTLLLSGQSFL
jgi:UDP-hydrolysing UDP-N-acetyl-D-glucosamine 2-epimerase